MKYIFDLSKDELGVYLKTLGEPDFRSNQIFSALHNGIEISDISNIPKSLREQIEKDFFCGLPVIDKEFVSKDGTKKYLLRLADNSLIECVLLTQDYGRTVCVSSQVGCKMACAFCASGKCGFVRNLSAGEILVQVVLLNRNILNAETRKHKKDVKSEMKVSDYRGITNIVVMGSGEPFDNFENTVKFFHLATCSGGINIGARNISVSTAGLADKIKQFADLKMQVNLCISLHASCDNARKSIMPIANKYTISEIIESAKYFFEKTKRRVIFEYALIDGINCTSEDAMRLAKLLRGFPNHVNLINLNSHLSEAEFCAGTGVQDNTFLRSPSKEVAKEFMNSLIKSGITCTMRKSKGSDISGACGQLKLQNSTRNDTACGGSS